MHILEGELQTWRPCAPPQPPPPSQQQLLLLAEEDVGRLRSKVGAAGEEGPSWGGYPAAFFAEVCLCVLVATQRCLPLRRGY